MMAKINEAEEEEENGEEQGFEEQNQQKNYHPNRINIEPTPTPTPTPSLAPRQIVSKNNQNQTTTTTTMDFHCITLGVDSGGRSSEDVVPNGNNDDCCKGKTLENKTSDEVEIKPIEIQENKLKNVSDDDYLYKIKENESDPNQYEERNSKIKAKNILVLELSKETEAENLTLTSSIQPSLALVTRPTIAYRHSNGAEKIMQTKSNQITLPNITMDEIGIIENIEAIENYNNNNNDDGYANDCAVNNNNNNNHANAEDGGEDHSSNIEFVGSSSFGNNNDDQNEQQIETKHFKNSKSSGKKGIDVEQNANNIGIIYDNHNHYDNDYCKRPTIAQTNKKEEEEEEEPNESRGLYRFFEAEDPSMGGRRSQVDKLNGNKLELELELSNEKSSNQFMPIYDAPINRNQPNGTNQQSSSILSLKKNSNTIITSESILSELSKTDINSNLHKTVNELRAEIANLRTDNVRLQNWNGSLQEKIFKMFQEDTATRTILDYADGRLGQSLINISTAKSYGSLDGGRDNLRKQINLHSIDADSDEYLDRIKSMNDERMAASAVASRRADRFNFRKRNSFLSENVSKNLLEQISLKQRNRILGSRIIMEHNDRCNNDLIDMRQDSKILGLKNNAERELFYNQNKKKQQQQQQPLGLSNYIGTSHKREQQKNGSCSPSNSSPNSSSSLSLMLAPNKDAHSDDMDRDRNRNPSSPPLNTMNLHQKRKLLRSNHLQKLQISMSMDQQQQLPLLYETESRQNPFNTRTSNHLNCDEVNNNNNYSVDGQIGNYSNNIINAKNINNVVDYSSATEMVVLRRPRLASPSMISSGGNIAKIEAKTSSSKGSLYHLADCIQMDNDDDNRKNQQTFHQIIGNKLSVGIDKKNYIVRTNFLGGTKHYKRSRQTFKMILIGDSTVGKTSLIHRIRTGQFSSDQFPTIGIDFQTIQVRLDGEYYDIQLWDTAGQERYHSITKNYYRRVDAICMVYDISKERTFLNVRHWLQSIRDTLFDSIPLLLMANKIDLRQHPGFEGYLVPPEQGYRLAAEIGNCGFIETSCLNGINVDQAILLATKMVLIQQQHHHQPQQLPLNGDDTIRMKTLKQQNRRGCC